jgi:hypothetical protein
MRELAGLRYSREEAGPIMKDVDPLEWGAMTPNPVAPGSQPVLPLPRGPRRIS